METEQGWRFRFSFSFKSATIVISLVNVVTLLLLLARFLGASSYSSRTLSQHQHDSEQLRYVMEAEAIRRALEPHELIKRVREIQQEAYTEPEKIVQRQASKKTTAVDLSKRLQDLRALNDANSKRALEEWRKRKMERARKREIGKDGTS